MISIPSSSAFCFTDLRNLDNWQRRVMCLGKVSGDCVLVLDIIKKIFGLIVITDLYQQPGEETVRMQIEFQIQG